MLETLVYRLLVLPFSPMLVAIACAGPRMKADVERWSALAQKWGNSTSLTSGRLTYEVALLLKPEFRGLVHVRLRGLGLVGRVVSLALGVLYKGPPGFFIDCPDLGPGLYIEHGFATIVNAERIGANCWINQQVTIGMGSHGDRPTLGDDVQIRAGAIVLGGIHVGDGARVLAGAVVTRDVPAGARAAGVPAKPIAKGDHS